MNTGHTPGHWRVKRIGREMYVEADGPVMVCDLQAHENPLSADEVASNAALIAAAPELLSALLQAYKILEKSVHFETRYPFWRKGGDGYAAMIDARAAIAKATGQA